MAAMVCKDGADDRSCSTSVQYVVCVHIELQAFSFFPLLVPPRNPSPITSLCVPLHLCNYVFVEQENSI